MFQGAGALRGSEWTLGGFFLYIALLSIWRNQGFSVGSAAAFLILAALVAVARADARSRQARWSIARDWLPAGLLLVAYWSIDWVPRKPENYPLEQLLVGWDRVLLHDWGIRSLAEQFGSLVPTVLELAYLLLYAVPPLLIASFYIHRKRDQVDDFLFPFLLGTLAAYALLPHVAVEGPRFVFAGEDLPGVETIFRRVNVWILDHWDIHSSVFPSGHVAAAFSAAFAMRLAAPERQRLSRILLVMAMLVWINTVYSRYHYAGDGLASFAVSAAMIGTLAAYRKRRTQTQMREQHSRVPSRL